MKNSLLHPFLCCLGMFAAAGIVSCSDDDKPAETSMIEVVTPALTIPTEGGGQRIEYRIVKQSENRSPATAAVTASADQPWLHDFDCSEAGVVRFTADPNPGDPREATLTLAFSTQTATLPVTQEGKPAAFAFELIDLTATGVTIHVSPLDPSGYYTWDLVSREAFDRHYPDDASLVEEHLKYLDAQLERYRNEVDAGGTLTDILTRNDDEQRINTLDPATEYVLFAFGVSETGEATTKPVKHSFTTPAFEATDPCTFRIEFARVEQLEFAFTVTPTDPATRYYIGLSDGSVLQQKSPEQIATDFIRQAEVAEIDWATTDALRTGTCTLHTFDDLEISDLKPDTEYSIVVFGVSDLGVRTTTVGHAEIRTAAVPHSDMTFQIEVVETSIQGAVIDVIPSKDDETYMAGTIRKEEYLKFTDDRAFMEYAVENGNIVLLDGRQRLDRTGALLTDKEYVCFAFGYIGGITTPLKYVEFRTLSHETTSKAEVAIRIEAKTHPNYDIALYAYLTPNEFAEHWYAGAFFSIDGVIQVPFSGEPLTDTEIINALTTNSAQYYWDEEYAATPGTFGTEYTFCVIARDAEGKLGRLVKQSVLADESLLQ